MVVLVVRPVHAGIAAGWLAEKRGAMPKADAVDVHDGAARSSARRVRPLPPVAPSIAAVVSAPVPHQNPIATLFSPEYRLRTVMAFGMWFFALIGFFGLNS